MSDSPEAFARIKTRNPWWKFWRPRVEVEEVSIDEVLERCRRISESARSHWRSHV